MGGRRACQAPLPTTLGPTYVEGRLVADSRDPHRARAEHVVPDPFQLGNHVIKVVHGGERLRERDLLEPGVPVRQRRDRRHRARGQQLRVRMP